MTAFFAWFTTNTALLRAMVPVFVSFVLLFGFKVEPALLHLVIDNINAFVLALPVLGLLFPSLKAAWLYKKSAD